MAVCRQLFPALLGLTILAVASGASASPTDPPGTSSPHLVAEQVELLDDAEIEHILLDGEVLSIEEIGSGVTKPRRVTLELDGRRWMAAFKTIEVHKPGVTTFRDGTQVIGFTDSFRYERAAYLLDRRLGLGMVPVTVPRQIAGEEGVLIDWVEEATSEALRMALHQSMPEGLRLQQNLMSVFDALIDNDDRHAANQLVTRDGKLHLIDHSRSFRTVRSLPKSFLKKPVGVTSVMLRNLEALERRDLDQLLGDLLSQQQIKALLARRDRILRKIRDDREEYGDGFVILDSRMAAQQAAQAGSEEKR